MIGCGTFFILRVDLGIPPIPWAGQSAKSFDHGGMVRAEELAAPGTDQVEHLDNHQLAKAVSVHLLSCKPKAAQIPDGNTFSEDAGVINHAKICQPMTRTLMTYTPRSTLEAKGKGAKTSRATKRCKHRRRIFQADVSLQHIFLMASDIVLLNLLLP